MHLLEGAKHPFVIWTGHENLTYIQGVKRLNPRQARWALFFNRFDFVLSHRPSSKNIKPDALSRQFESQEKEDRSEPIIPRSRVLAGIQWDLETVVRKAQHHQPDPGNGQSAHLFVPNTIRFEVLQWAQAAPSSGVLRTLRSQSKFWWSNMRSDLLPHDPLAPRIRNLEPSLKVNYIPRYPETTLVPHIHGFCQWPTQLSR